jgi:hypothetical protein
MYRNNVKDLFVGRVKMNVAMPGEEVYDMVSWSNDIVFGFESGKQKSPDFDMTHNWVK